MAVELYVPYKLQSEIDRFKELKGNVNIDYRSGNVSTPYVLDTSYVKFNNVNMEIGASVSPFTISEQHVSGDNNNFRNFSTDLLVENNGTFQTNVIVLNTLQKTVKAAYRSTTAIKIGPRNTLVHLYAMDSSLPPNTTLIPVYLTGLRSKIGVVDKKTCEKLTTTEVKDLISITVSGTSITIVQDSSIDNGHNIAIDEKLIDEDIKDISVFQYADSNNKSTSKLRLISGVDKNYTNINPSPLSVVVPNYNLYYNSTSNSENAEGYCINLKPKESVLFNISIQTSLENYTSIIPLGVDSVLVSEAYTGSLNTYFSSLRFELPTTKPLDYEGTPLPFKVMIDGTVHKLDSYIDIEFSKLCSDLRTLLEPKGIYLIERADKCLFLYGVNSTDVSLTFAYSDFKVFTEEDVSKVDSLYVQPTLIYTENGYPPNLSLAYDDYIDKELFSLIGEADSDFYCFSLNMKGNVDKSPVTNLLNSVTYLVDKDILKGSIHTLKSKEVSLVVDLTASNLPTIITDLRTVIQPSLTDITIEVDEVESTITFKNSLTTPKPFEVKFTPMSIDLPYNGLYNIVEGIDRHLLRGSS